MAALGVKSFDSKHTRNPTKFETLKLKKKKGGGGRIGK